MGTNEGDPLADAAELGRVGAEMVRAAAREAVDGVKAAMLFDLAAGQDPEARGAGAAYVDRYMAELRAQDPETAVQLAMFALMQVGALEMKYGRVSWW